MCFIIISLSEKAPGRPKFHSGFMIAAQLLIEASMG